METTTIDSELTEITAPVDAATPVQGASDPAVVQADMVAADAERSNVATPSVSIVEEPTAETEPVALTSVTTSTPTTAVDVSPTLDAAERLEEQLAAFTIPPTWVETVESSWDTSIPWKEARQEIRTLLGKGDEVSRREGIKLTWVYLQKDDIGNGHEYGMNLFLGREPLWAIHVHRECLARTDHDYPPYFGIHALAVSSQLKAASDVRVELNRFARRESLLEAVVACGIHVRLCGTSRSPGYSRLERVSRLARWKRISRFGA